MWSRKKTLSALLASALLALAVLIFILRDDNKRALAPPPTPTPDAATDSSAAHNAEVMPSPVSEVELQNPMPSSRTARKTMTPFDSSTAPFMPDEPEPNDTLRRYGARATNMQMLIELLEEKQLLMEEKVELSRRLEVVEILDSVALGNASSDTLIATASAADSSQRRDTLSVTPPTFVDSLKSAATIPPRR